MSNHSKDPRYTTMDRYNPPFVPFYGPSLRSRAELYLKRIDKQTVWTVAPGQVWLTVEPTCEDEYEEEVVAVGEDGTIYSIASECGQLVIYRNEAHFFQFHTTRVAETERLEREEHEDQSARSVRLINESLATCMLSPEVSIRATDVVLRRRFDELVERAEATLARIVALHAEALHAAPKPSPAVAP